MESFSVHGAKGMALKLSILVFVVLIGACGHSMNGVYHTVQKGETLYRIGKTYGVDSQQIARVNRIFDPQSLRVGQRLYVPGADRVKKVPVVSPSVNPVRKPSLQVARPEPNKISPSQKSRPSVKIETAPPATAPKTVPPRFYWPVKGKIVKNFNPSEGN